MTHGERLDTERQLAALERIADAIEKLVAAVYQGTDDRPGYVRVKTEEARRNG